ncbi:MAG: hypothetical protein EG825_16975, partial [Rhodocyclaceae bacterium]|nr:hypothetical protein [Rhodocyclaceae bacterium]
NIWSGVPGIMGFRGDNLTTATGVNPQTVLVPDEPGVVNVIANQSDVTILSGGVYEFDGIANPVVAMQGSGTADAPYLLIHLNTTGMENIQVSYNVRDIDSTADNSIQQVALHYRVGGTGNYTNLPDGYIPDASSGPSLATLVTPVSVTLPADANNQTTVQLRIMTTNAVGNDEWVGIDDISITGTMIGEPAPTVVSTSPANGAEGVALASDLTVTFSEPVAAPDGAFTLSCATSGAHTFARSTTDDVTFTLNPDADFSEGELCTASVLAAQVTDLDTIDPNDNMLADYVFTFTTYMSDPAPEVASTVPANNEPGVAVDAPLSVTFSEAVTLADGAVAISCVYSGAHSAVVTTTDSITHTITPDVAFTESERCTVTLESTLISDSSAQNPAADYTWSFTTYYDPAAVTPIAVARAAGAGWTGTLQGNVTL